MAFWLEGISQNNGSAPMSSDKVEFHQKGSFYRIVHCQNFLQMGDFLNPLFSFLKFPQPSENNLED
jgi:hypothetical protein